MKRHPQRKIPTEDEHLSDGTIIYWAKRERHINRFDLSYYTVPVKCPDCQRIRDVQSSMITRMRRQGKWTGLCNHCVGKVTLPKPSIGQDSRNWKGGRYLHSSGYWYVTIPQNHPFASMAPPSQQKKKYGLLVIGEHRLIMAKHLGRPLESWEIVHHKDENKTNNAIDNLELMPHASTHNTVTFLMRHIRELEEENQKLRQLLSQQDLLH